MRGPTPPPGPTSRAGVTGDSDSRFLHDLPSEAVERLKLVRAGLPIPERLIVKNPGNKAYPSLNNPPLRTTRTHAGLDKVIDPRKIHMEDGAWECFSWCKLFWQYPAGTVLLRHTTNWDEVTCRKCLAEKSRRERKAELDARPLPSELAAPGPTHG